VEAETVAVAKIDVVIMAVGTTGLEAGAVKAPKEKGKGGIIPHPRVSHPVRDQAAAQTFAMTSTRTDASPSSATAQEEEARMQLQDAWPWTLHGVESCRKFCPQGPNRQFGKRNR